MARSFRGTNTQSRITKIPRVRIEIQSFSGSVDSSSSRVSLSPAKSFLANIASSAFIKRRTNKGIIGAIDSNGSMTTATIFRRILISAIATSAVIFKTSKKTFTGFNSATGLVVKSTTHKILASIAISAVLTKAIAKRFNAAISSAGSLLRQINKILIALINSSSTKIKFIVNKAINGSIEIYDSLHATSKRVIVLLSHLDQHGAVAFHKTLFRTLQGQIGASGAKISAASKSFISMVSGAGSLKNKSIKNISASIDSAGSIIKYKTIIKHFISHVTSAAVIRRFAQIKKYGNISIAEAQEGSINKYLHGVTNLVGVLVRLFFPPPTPTSGVIEVRSRVNVTLSLENIDIPIVNVTEDLIITLEIQSLDNPELSKVDYDISLEIAPVLNTELTLTGL